MRRTRVTPSCEIPSHPSMTRPRRGEPQAVRPAWVFPCLMSRGLWGACAEPINLRRSVPQLVGNPTQAAGVVVLKVHFQRITGTVMPQAYLAHPSGRLQALIAQLGGRDEVAPLDFSKLAYKAGKVVAQATDQRRRPFRQRNRRPRSRLSG